MPMLVKATTSERCQELLIKIRKTCLFATVVCLFVIVFAGQAQATSSITIAKPARNKTIPESHDFPTERFADPWDMSKYTDLSFGQNMNDLGRITWKGGTFTARTTGNDPSIQPLFAGFEGVLFNGRDGYINRIPTRKYNRFSVRMYSSRKTSGQLFWFYDQRWSKFGVVTFTIEKGWHTYIVNPRPGGKWKGKPLGLRLDPGQRADTKIKIDWMRLYRQTTRRVKFEWTDSAPKGTTKVYLDTDKNPSNGNKDLLKVKSGRSSDVYYWDPSGYSPGNYFLYVKPGNREGQYSRRITINRAPLTKIFNPDEMGGKDYAGSVTRDPWDMAQSSDIWYSRNLKDVVFSKGYLSAVPSTGDGYFHLRVPTKIDADKYHRLVFRMRYDGPFHYGDGTMSRVIWSPDHHNIDLFQVSNDIIVYPTWETYVIDLKKASLDQGTIGWNGLVDTFRFDPLEWRARRRFQIDFIKLRADDTANKRFTVKWRDAKKVRRPTRVSLYYDNNKSGFNGRRFAKNLLQRKGLNRFTWNTSRVPAGEYYVYAIAKDGKNVTKTYSSGPVQIVH